MATLLLQGKHDPGKTFRGQIFAVDPVTDLIILAIDALQITGRQKDCPRAS
jgi:hypothetical protein